MDGMEDEEVIGNVDSEHESVSSGCETKDWNCEEHEAQRDYRNEAE
jgi:hypothetical protein